MEDCTIQHIGHAPIMVDEVNGYLINNTDGVYLDATMGQAGHSKEILNKLSANAKLFAIDADPATAQVADSIKDSRFTFMNLNFADLDQLPGEKFDGIFMDLGISSVQLDDFDRGFSFNSNAELDMRINTSSSMTAKQWLEQSTEADVANALYFYADETRSRTIAKKIKTWLKQEANPTCIGLANVVKQVYQSGRRATHPATKTFLAIRIAVNEEVENLKKGLQVASEMLAVGGRLVVISFHSTEDRLVKRFFKQGSFELIQQDDWRNSPLPPAKNKDIGQADGQSVTKLTHTAGPIHPSYNEIRDNPRARSAILRVATKL